ncbi:MAG: penicillin-binding protein 2 [Candidatus Omnitrophica bacterium]|nr:penicillin-binding protein 2 [Candidatus Omnitrophota bacterium]
MEQKKRLRIIVWIFFGCFGLIFLRLAFLQIKEAPELKRKARAKNYSLISEPAPRGAIYDREGRPLAISIPYYELYAEPKYLKETPAEVARKIAPVISESPAKLIIDFSSGKGFVWLNRRLPYDEYVAIKKLAITGIGVQETFFRSFPEGKIASHIIGLVNTDGKGLEGIEKQYNHIISGQDGKVFILRDGKGNPIPSSSEGVPARPGPDIFLTIDIKVQRILEEEIEKVFKEYSARGAAGIVLDADNGEVLALTNRPTYDPNPPVTSSLDCRRNRSVTDIFEPGSVFKMVTAAAGLEERVVKPEDNIFCENGKYFVRNHTIHDTHPYGMLTFREVIAKSSNIGTVKVGFKLGAEGMYRYATAFGFGKKTGIDLPGEVSGILRPVSRWSDYSMTAIPFGQEVSATVLQCAAALGAIINGGNLYQPYLVKGVRDKRGRFVPERKPVPVRRVISQATSDTLISILTDVVSEEGTAQSAAIPGYRVGGKTGTAQKVESGRYSHNKYFASFSGFIKTPSRKLVICVMVDEPRGAYYGGVVAGPAFNRIGQRTVLALGIAPDQPVNSENENSNGVISARSKRESKH